MKLYYLLLLSALRSVPATFHLRLLSIVIMTTHFNCFWPAPPRLSSEAYVSLLRNTFYLSIQSFHEKLTEIPSCTADECCSQQTRVQTTLPPYSETLLLSDACSESIATAFYPTCQVISDSHSPPTNFPRQIFTLFPAHPIPPIPFASFLSQFLPESR